MASCKYTCFQILMKTSIDSCYHVVLKAESEEHVTQFRGGKKICQKECVLIINTKTRVIPFLVVSHESSCCYHIRKPH